MASPIVPSQLRQVFITPRCPQQNGMVERVIRTFKNNARIGIASRIFSTPAAL